MSAQPVLTMPNKAGTTKSRRVSSMSSSRPQLDSGPTVPLPPAEYMASTIPDSIAAARSEVDDAVIDDSSDNESLLSPMDFTPDYAFAFDIDGVLIKGGEVIPEAIEAMRVLNGENPDGVKVPYIFVTNGGGKTEAERCGDLSKQLDTMVDPGQFICGHTPMRDMAKKYRNVLVVGGEGEKCRQVAEGYGFTNALTPGDVMKWKASVTPFRKLTDDEYINSRDIDFGQLEIDAIFVFADSRHWGDDIQIIMDLLLSKNGRLGTVSKSHEEGPPLYFSHNDVVWATAHPNTRYGMGALRVMIEALYEKTTGKTLKNVESFGKPQIGTFRYATKVLAQWRKDIFNQEGAPSTIYFVGDTPESDIQGTNLYNKHVEEEWHSILVKTGVYEDGTTPAHIPGATVETVLDAVKYGMERSKTAALASRKENKH